MLPLMKLILLTLPGSESPLSPRPTLTTDRRYSNQKSIYFTSVLIYIQVKARKPIIYIYNKGKSYRNSTTPKSKELSIRYLTALQRMSIRLLRSTPLAQVKAGMETPFLFASYLYPIYDLYSFLETVSFACCGFILLSNYTLHLPSYSIGSSLFLVDFPSCTTPEPTYDRRA